MEKQEVGSIAEEPKKMSVIGHLEELRRRILAWLGVMLGAVLLFWLKRDALMGAITKPMRDLQAHLITIDPTEAFSAYMKVVFLAAFILCAPFTLFQIWAFLAPALPRTSKNRAFVWLFLILFLFSAGVLLSYYFIVPAALDFLIPFGQGIAQASITLERYVSFFVMMILVCGVIFEIPLLMGFLAELGILHAKALRKQRRVVAVVSLILAALLTPTPDACNMIILAVPIYLLFEAGVLVARGVEKKKNR